MRTAAVKRMELVRLAASIKLISLGFSRGSERHNRLEAHCAAKNKKNYSEVI